MKLFVLPRLERYKQICVELQELPRNMNSEFSKPYTVLEVLRSPAEAAPHGPDESLYFHFHLDQTMVRA